MKHDFSKYVYDATNGHDAHTNFMHLYDTHRELTKAIRKYLRAVVGNKIYTLHRILSQEGHAIEKVGPEGVMFSDHYTWSDKGFKGLGIENMLNIINNILEGGAWAEPSPPAFLLNPDRNYSVSVDELPAAVLTKGAKMEERLHILLQDQFALPNPVILKTTKDGENSVTYIVQVEVSGVTLTSEVLLRIVPLY